MVISAGNFSIVLWFSSVALDSGQRRRWRQRRDTDAACSHPISFAAVLLEVMAQVRTLKFDDVGVDIWHRASSVFYKLNGPALRACRSKQHLSPGRRSFQCRAASIGRAGEGGVFSQKQEFLFRLIQPNCRCRRRASFHRAQLVTSIICRLRSDVPRAGKSWLLKCLADFKQLSTPKVDA